MFHLIFIITVVTHDVVKVRQQVHRARFGVLALPGPGQAMPLPTYIIVYARSFHFR